MNIENNKIVTLNELKADKTNIKYLPELDQKPVFLCRMEYYDGPLSGYCLYNGKPHYFKCFIDYHSDILMNIKTRNRVFAVIEVTDEQFQLDENNKKIFNEYVGYHTEYKDDGKTRQDRYPVGSIFDDMSDDEKEKRMRYFYDVLSKNRKYNDFSNNKVVAFWDDIRVYYKNTDKLKNYNLILLLKQHIKDVVSGEYHELNKDNKNYLKILYDTNVRAHLIAYCLLRGKSYKAMENKCRVPYNEARFYYNCLKTEVRNICLKYSMVDDHENWSKEKIDQIFDEARKDG